MKATALLAGMLTATALLGIFMYATAGLWIAATATAVDRESPSKPTAATNLDIDYALRVQAERNANHPHYPQWTPEWAEPIERHHEACTLSTGQWEMYARGSVTRRTTTRFGVRSAASSSSAG